MTPLGVCVEAVRGAATAMVQMIEFVSEEDGDNLIERLEGFGSDILGKIPASPPIQPKQVQHLLAIIRRDNTATVYLNELKTRAMIQPKRDLKVGDTVFADDIADVHRLEFEGIQVPNDAGIVFIFAVGWRRALL